MCARCRPVQSGPGMQRTPPRVRQIPRHGFAVAMLVVVGAARAGGADAERGVLVTSVAELQRAAAAARPGTRIRIGPGTYPGGVHLVGLTGAAGRPVVLEAADPERPPVFEGGGSGLQLSDPA